MSLAPDLHPDIALSLPQLLKIRYWAKAKAPPARAEIAPSVANRDALPGSPFASCAPIRRVTRFVISTGG